MGCSAALDFRIEGWYILFLTDLNHRKLELSLVYRRAKTKSHDLWLIQFTVARSATVCTGLHSGLGFPWMKLVAYAGSVHPYETSSGVVSADYMHSALTQMY